MIGWMDDWNVSQLKRCQKGDRIKRDIWEWHGWAGQCEVEVIIICFVYVVVSNRHCFL